MTLLEAGIRGLAYEWKSEKTPGAEQLKEIGLLQKLEVVTTQTEVDIENIVLRYLNLLKQQILGRIKKLKILDS